jgi:hypothetical protein
MKNTVFSGYIWDKYSHVSPQHDDMTGMVDPLPVTSGGMLKINSNASNEMIGNFEPIKQYYLWTKLEHNATKGIVTCKRKPSEITLDDIIGFYLVDCDGSIGQEYIGIENIRDKEREGWVSNISSSINYDTLELVWEEDGTSGVDTFGFVGELTDIDIDDGSSNNLEDYCFNFSNSGTITITLTNLGNYALRDGTLYPINLYGGTGKVFGFDLCKYGSTVTVHRVRVNTISATQTTGEKTSATATLNVPSAGLYYVKCNIGTNIGTSSGYYFSMGTSDLVNYHPCDIICDWSLHVEAKETMPDNMAVPVGSYLNSWYEKLGKDEKYHPNNINLKNFGNLFGWDDNLDKLSRVLWNYNNNGYVSIIDAKKVYPVNFLTGCHVHNVAEADYDVPRLVHVADVPDFEIINVGLDGTVKYPDHNNLQFMSKITTTLKINGQNSSFFVNIPFSETSFFNKSVEETILKQVYFEPDIYNPTTNSMSLNLDIFTDMFVYDVPNTGGILSEGDPIPITFSSGATIDFYTTDESSYSKLNNSVADYAVDLNNQWRKSSKTISGYGDVYESYSNYQVDNGTATMRIAIMGYKKFSIYIRSYAESNYDYVMVSQLDQEITGSTSTTNTTLVKAHTKGNQKSGTTISNYTLVEYTNIDGGSHTITIVYRKDGSKYSGDDRGYVVIGKDTEHVVYSEYYSNIIARPSFQMNARSLALLGPIVNIDFSSLNFKLYFGGGAIEQYLELNYLDYILRTGAEGKLHNNISLRNSSSQFTFKETKGDFIDLDGRTILSNVTFHDIDDKMKFLPSHLVEIYNTECYFKFPIVVGDNMRPIYLCLHLMVNSDGFTIFNDRIDDCTVWFSDTLSTNITFINNSQYTSATIEMSDGYTYLFDDVDITMMNDIFGFGRVYSPGLASTIHRLDYGRGNIDIYTEGALFSFISPGCETIEDLYLWLHQDTPSITLLDGGAS